MLSGVDIVVNVLVAILLAVTIGYCYLLNRRIQLLQNSKHELAELLGHFDESTRRATDSIHNLQAAAKKIGETIQSRIDKANFAIDDLNNAIAKAEKTTDKVEASLAIARQKEKLQSESAQPHYPVSKDTLESHVAHSAPSKIPLDSLDALQDSAPRVSSLQSLIERVSNRASTDPVLRGNQKITQGMASNRPPSESEQELLNALQSLVKG